MRDKLSIPKPYDLCLPCGYFYEQIGKVEDKRKKSAILTKYHSHRHRFHFGDSTPPMPDKTPSPTRSENPIDPVEAEAGKRDGIKRATKGSPEGFNIAAAVAIQQIAETIKDFTTDEVWAVMPEPWQRHQVEGRWIGGAMQKKWREGIIEYTGIIVSTKARNSHQSKHGVWHSLIWHESNTAKETPQ